MSRALSFYVGSALFGLGGLECFLNEASGSGDIWYDPSYASFMFMGDLLLLLWMWGVSLQVWRSCGIDFMKLLSLETTTLVSMDKPEETVYGCAKELTIVYLATFICFNMTQRGFFGGEGGLQRKSFHVVHVLPLLMIAYFVYRAITPWQIKRKWFWFLYKVICAPLYAVDFQAGYVGDLLTSLVRVLISMAYSVIYYLLVPLAMFMTFDASEEESEFEKTGGEEQVVVERLTGFQYMRQSSWWSASGVVQILIIPALTLAPLVIRLFQCLRRSVESGQRWPHVANAAKYTSAIMVVATGTLLPYLKTSWLWVFSFVGATCYQFLWDITMDWGLVVKSDNPLAQDSTAFGGLAFRKTRLLGPLPTYMAIMTGNLILRFAWTLTLVQQSSYADSSADDDNSDGGGGGSWTVLFSALFAHLTPVIAAAEVLRRMVWGFLRLEWEQIEKMTTLFLNEDGKDEGEGEERHMGIKAPRETDPLVGNSSGGSQGMERMAMGHASGFPDFYTAWDPDGRFHSVLPSIAFATSCCATVDFPALFEDTRVPLSEWLLSSVCESRILAPLLADMTGHIAREDEDEDEDGGDDYGAGAGGAGGAGAGESSDKSRGRGPHYETQRRRFVEGVLFAGGVVGYLAVLVLLRLVYGK